MALGRRTLLAGTAALAACAGNAALANRCIDPAEAGSQPRLTCWPAALLQALALLDWWWFAEGVTY